MLEISTSLAIAIKFFDIYCVICLELMIMVQIESARQQVALFRQIPIV